MIVLENRFEIKRVYTEGGNVEVDWVYEDGVMRMMIEYRKAGHPFSVRWYENGVVVRDNVYYEDGTLVIGEYMKDCVYDNAVLPD